MPIVVRTVAPHELAAVVPIMDGVMQRAYGVPSFRAQLSWHVAVQPDAIVVACDGDTIVGTGCGIAYREAGFGWIGLIGTEPAHERRGIGTLVTARVEEILASLGCAAVLDASAAGRAVYERMGFADHGATRIFGLPRAGGLAHGRVVPITTADRAEVAAYDARTFGADRTRLIHLLLDASPDRSGLVRGDDGRVAGFAIAQAVSVGPLEADDAGVLGELVAFAAGLAWEGSGRINVPPEYANVDLLTDLGCTPQRELRNMRRGVATLPGRPHAYVGRISLGIG